MAPDVSVAHGDSGVGLPRGDLRAGHLVHRHGGRRYSPGAGRRALDEARKELRGKTDRYTQKPLLEHPSTQRSLEAAEGLW